jgi:hypothetical protein
MLYVHRAGTPVSRQLRGSGAEHDLQISQYNSPDELSDIVERWLCSRRHAIADGSRRRRNRMLRFAEPHARLHHAWEALSQDEKDHVVAVIRIAPRRAPAAAGFSLSLCAAGRRRGRGRCIASM